MSPAIWTTTSSSTRRQIGSNEAIKRGQVFEILADLTDEDGGLVEMGLAGLGVGRRRSGSRVRQHVQRNPAPTQYVHRRVGCYRNEASPQQAAGYHSQNLLQSRSKLRGMRPFHESSASRYTFSPSVSWYDNGGLCEQMNLNIQRLP